MNKSLITNLTSTLIAVAGYFSPIYSNYIFSTGIFAMSGAVTNWLAIHMLFEKVPLLYGSGVIPNKFQEFKLSIKTIIMEEFFNPKNISKFLNSSNFSEEKIDSKVDLDKAFNHLVDAIVESPLGGMLAMMGGREALEPLKDPMKEKMALIIQDVKKDITGSNEGLAVLSQKAEEIIDHRLNELTPEAVKIMVQNIIKNHLGWLVIWGGVLGGLIGLIFSLVNQNL